MDETWLSVKEVAQVMHVKPKTVREWIKKGIVRRVTMVNPRAGYLIPKAEVDRLFREYSR